MEHLRLAELQAGLDHIREAPADGGTLELIVCRPATGQREVLTEGTLDLVTGLIGDNWKVRGSTSTPDGAAHPDAQITMMNARAALLVARGPDWRPLAGDQLYADLDISVANLPPGTRLAIGSAVIEVTGKPHLGCFKFLARFGRDAMKFVNCRAGRELRLRGLNARIVVPGTIRPGDVIRKVATAAETHPDLARA